MRGWGLAECLLCGAVSLGAAGQSTATKAPVVGTVIGHVFCADTQRPARLAQVRLVKVPQKSDGKLTAGAKDAPAGGVGDAVETSLDGSFAIHNVTPGEYYLEVDAIGYLSPLTQFTSAQLSHPDEAEKVEIARTLKAIGVSGDQTIRQEVTLERGAAVSGTVTYDDGTPASGIPIQLLQKDAKGVWQARQFNGALQFGYTGTDDRGRFRIDGLPAGEYAAQAMLSLNDIQTSVGPMPGSPNTMVTFQVEKTRFSLALYSGDVLRKKEITPFTLGAGEERDGMDLVLPISKLHKVSGQVLAKDGHAVNGGSVKLAYADDPEETIESTDVRYADALFEMEFVPEGEYQMQVSGAEDRTTVQVANPAGYEPRFHTEDKVTRSYGPAEQPLIVKGEMSDVSIVVPDAKAAGGSK